MTSPEKQPNDIITTAGRSSHPRLLLLFAIMALTGAAVFIAGILGSQPQRIWQAYLINFIFWTGMTAGCLLFSAILSITHAHWGRSLKRLAEAPVIFLPVALILFIVLYPGRREIFPWILHPVAEKEAWLNARFLFLRDGVGLLALAAAGLKLIAISVRREQGETLAQPLRHEKGREEKGAVVAANIYAMLYALILSLLAFDLVMSLSPHWYSSLFGAYYFVGSFSAALALLMVLALFFRRERGLQNFIRSDHLINLGKLMLGFILVTGDFFFTQFLVIWYGNLPEETHFIILRTQLQPWSSVAWTVLLLGFVLPFVLLLSRKVKMHPLPMLAISFIILATMWLDKFLLIAPSLWTGPGLPLGLAEVFISLGFFGIMGLCILLFLGRFPLLPYGDPLFHYDLAQFTETDGDK